MNSSDKPPGPGISRDKRISDDGLQRLERQLASGSRINPAILEQWIRRYGRAAEKLIERYRNEE